MSGGADEEKTQKRKKKIMILAMILICPLMAGTQRAQNRTY